MYLKKSIWIWLWFVLLFSCGLTACGNVKPTAQTTTANASDTGTTRWVNDFSELPKGTASRVEVVYFHRSVRCEACLNAESYTRETLARYFADQMQSGLISLQVLDMELPENAALVKKFDAAGSALYLSVLIQGTEYLCPNPDIWFYTSNKYLFVDTLRKKLASLVGGGVMDLGPWVQMVLTNGNASMVGAFLIGLLASLGPCSLTTNIAALGYITRELASPRRVLLTSGLYTLGRTCAYGVLGIALFAAGLQISRVSNSMQTLAEIALGPLLILVGLVLLDVIHPMVNLGGAWMERWSKRVADWNSVGAFLLGILFALAFCPYSAALYFGVLIPLAFKSAGGIAFPFLFGIGTSIPVIVIGAPLALGVKRFASGLDILARVERVMRKIAALAFIGAGIFMVWNWAAAN